MSPTPAVVQAVDGIKEDFLKRHRKNRHRAREVWADLVEKKPFLEQDTGLGDAIPRMGGRPQGVRSIVRILHKLRR